MKKKILYVLMGLMLGFQGWGQLYFKGQPTSTTEISVCYENSSQDFFYISVPDNPHKYFIVQYSLNGIDNWSNITGISDLKYTAILNNSTNMLEYLDVLIGSKTNSAFYRAVFSASLSNLSTSNVDASIGANSSTVSPPLKITINQLPTATIIGTTAVCKNATAPTITFTGSDATAPYTFTYTINGGSSQTVTTTSGNSVIVNAPTNASGSFVYALTGVSESSGTACTNTVSGTATVTVNPLPVVTFEAAPSLQECQNTELTYTTQAGKSNYLWTPSGTLNFDYVITSGGLSITDNTVTLKWLTTGNKTIQVNYTDANTCTAAIPTNTSTNINPNTSITTQPVGFTVCAGGLGVISATATGTGTVTYQWFSSATNTNSGGTLIGSATSASYYPDVTVAGMFYYYVVATSTCSSVTSNAVTITVNALPTATITAGSTTTFCIGGSVTLTSSAGSSYSWSNGATTQSIIVTTAGSYSVTVTNASGCAATSAATNVIVNALPTATITAGGATTFCAGGSVTLTSSAGSSYSWSNGATTQSIIVTTAGSYSVTETNANGCTTTSSATLITVNPLPTATITAGGATTFCAGGSVTLTSSAGSSYSWSNGATTQSITVTTAGSYSVTVTNASGCAATSAATNVIVNALPIASITAGGATTFCAGGSVTLTSNAGSSYVWSTGATTQSIIVTTAGSYSVTVTNASGCSAISVATSVRLKVLPTITVTNPIAVCSPNTIDLTATAVTSGSTASLVYNYFTNAAATTVLGIPSAVATSGTYYIKGTDANSCSSISPVVTTINALPVVSYVATKSKVCLGESLTLTGIGANIYAWDNGVTDGNPFTPVTTQTYHLSGTDLNGCVNVTSVTIPVNALPTITQITTSANKLMVGSDLILNNSASNGLPPYSYIWNNSNSAVAGINGLLNPTLTGLNVGFVDLKYYVIDANGCKSLTSSLFNVEIIPAVMKFEIPNAFIPTDIYMDNKFLKAAYNSSVKHVNYFRVFNRMGKLVYEIQNADPSAIKWDGTYNNVMQESDGYMWIAEITGLGSITFERKLGQFLLLK